MAGASPDEQDVGQQIAALRKMIEELRALPERLSALEKAQKALVQQVAAIEKSSAAGVEAATDAAEKSARAAADAKAAAKQATTDAGAAKTAAEKAGKEAKAASGRIEAIEPRVTQVQSVQEGFGTQMGELTRALGGDPIQLDGNDAGLAPFLQIRLREVEFDPLVRRAIAKVGKDQPADAGALANDIIAKGLGTAVAKVTDRLSRIRMSEPKRQLLAVVYPALLRARLGDPVRTELVQDPIGLADSLVADLDRSDGPMDALAKAVIDSSETTLSLNLDDSKREALTLRVRESI
ncbi:hypothetical protein [Sphingobium yanoikuyae]|uniref:hypothetical protein n=1 Tax=Sphingobium yanoikuyae TaxID=13690 RepID=UPI0035B44D3B